MLLKLNSWKQFMFLKIYGVRDFPGGPMAKTLLSQRRGFGFDPWLGN